MADPASKFTDEELKKVEKQLKSIYNQAYKDILQKQKDFNNKHQEKSKKYLEKVAKGEMTQAQYDDWLKGQVFQGDQWQAKKKQMLDVIYNSNKTATDILNGKTRGVFAFNATYANYDLEHGAGVNFGFGIYDTNTVINLVKNNPKLLPEWKIDQAKDYKWSQKKLNKQISLGILEGESLDKIATRLCNNLCTTNFNKMRTFARTAMTGAQNEGRLFSYENAKGLGIKVKKQWMCTLDDHTRITHQQLDGQTQDIDKPFEVDGLKIRYPGDPTAEAALVFNCRCTMVGDIEDYPATYDRYDNIDGRPIKQMTYEEWLDAKSKGSDILPVPLTFSHTEQMTAETKHIIIQGQDISTTWERRPDQFDFEIEDVINAQGFDGLPRVVSAEEFNEAVKAANGGNGFIAQRTYSAPDQETLDAYRQQLYEGKWYVDCSVGTAAYGQGMYATGDFKGLLTDDVEKATEFYRNLNTQKGNKFSAVETFTLTPDAKIADYRKLLDDFRKYGIETQEKNAEIRRTAIKEANRKLADELLKNSKYNTADAKKFLYGNLSLDDVGWEEMGKAYQNLGNEGVNAINALQGEFYKRQTSYVDKYVNKQLVDEIKDIGSYAASKGYDAISVTGYGVYNSNEVVILNRTKVIIREGK